MQEIIFRLDFGENIGMGHLMRCLVLAKKFKNANITFACFGVDESKFIKENGFNFHKLKSQNIHELIELIKLKNASLLIIDHYKISHKDEKKIKKQTKVKLIVLDDNFKKHYCDMLINHNCFAKKKHYKGKVTKNCRLKCGKKHTLLREEFKIQRQKKGKKTGILIALGSSDNKNLSQKIIEKIPPNVHVMLVTSSLNPELPNLKNFLKNKKNIALFVDTKDMAKLMRKSRFAFITPSVLANEALFMGLDFVAIKTAKNQAHMYKYLKAKKYLCFKNIEKIDMEKIIKKYDLK